MNNHPCFVCGSHVAPFGYGPMGVKVREEPHKYRWYCGGHRPDRPETPVVAATGETVAQAVVWECPF
jgi:hypothetical protein